MTESLALATTYFFQREFDAEWHTATDHELTAHKRTERPVALITGASSGIGAALAKLIAQDGYNLVLVARNEEKLSQLAQELTRLFPIQCHCINQDLARNSAGRNLFIKLNEQQLRIDLLVNNAGVGMHGEFADTPLEKTLEIIAVNITALTELTRLLLPDMLARRHGQILNVSSIAAYQPSPNMAVYFASKAYVLSFSQGLRQELNGTGVTCTTVCPGMTDTAFLEHANMEDTWLSKLPRLSAEKVAKIAYRGLKKGRNIVIPGATVKLTTWFSRIVPQWWMLKIFSLLQKKRA